MTDVNTTLIQFYAYGISDMPRHSNGMHLTLFYLFILFFLEIDDVCGSYGWGKV